MSNGKRLFAFAFRRWLVEQARRPGASVAGLALRHGINANQLRRWMALQHKLASGGAGVALLPVTIEAAGVEPVAATVAAAPAATSAGPIEVEVFGARLRLHGEVDPQRLRVVLDALAARRA